MGFQNKDALHLKCAGYRPFSIVDVSRGCFFLKHPREIRNTTDLKRHGLPFSRGEKKFRGVSTVLNLNLKTSRHVLADGGIYIHFWQYT